MIIILLGMTCSGGIVLSRILQQFTLFMISLHLHEPSLQWSQATLLPFSMRHVGCSTDLNLRSTSANRCSRFGSMIEESILCLNFSGCSSEFIIIFVGLCAFATAMNSKIATKIILTYYSYHTSQKTKRIFEKIVWIWFNWINEIIGELSNKIQAIGLEWIIYSLHSTVKWIKTFFFAFYQRIIFSNFIDKNLTKYWIFNIRNELIETVKKQIRLNNYSNKLIHPMNHISEDHSIGNLFSTYREYEIRIWN